MKRQHKTITREMIQQCFGRSARISRFLGSWKVRTASGGLVKIAQSGIRVVYGGSDVYRSGTLLANEAWGGGQVEDGCSPETKLAWLAHGEAEGVPMRVGEGGAFARAVVACLIVLIGCNVLDSEYGPVISGVVALVVWLLMKRAAKLKAQREAQQLGYHYPRVHGDAGEASDEDLKKGGWL
jgi:hypothetical protein